MEGGQVLGSLVAFSLIYLSLMAVWLIVLDRKIKAGPGPVPPEEPDEGGLLDAAGQRTTHEERMTGPLPDGEGGDS